MDMVGSTYSAGIVPWRMLSQGSWMGVACPHGQRRYPLPKVARVDLVEMVEL